MADEGTFLGEVQRGWQRFWRLSWWWKGPIIGLVALVAIGIIGAIAGGGDEDKSDSTARAITTASPTKQQTEAPSETEGLTDTPPPTAAPTPEPTPEPTPTPRPGFGDGTQIVGEDVQPGTYRSTGDSLCYWARLKGFSNELDDITANGNHAPEIVTISQTDAGFQTRGCGRWLPVESTTPAAPDTTFGDGTYQVGVHISPGQYRADGEGICYWARLSDFSQELGGIITNGNDPTIIEIAPTDAGFTTFGCGTWTPR